MQINGRKLRYNVKDVKEDVAIKNENYTVISKIKISFRRERINGSYCKLCGYLDFSFFQFSLRPLTYLLM